MSRVIVTGGAGFIGSHLVERLLAEEHEVWIFDNFNQYYDPKQKRKNVSRLGSVKNLTTLTVDVCDGKKVVAQCQKIRPGIVIHLAAEVGVRPSLEKAPRYTEVNVVGSANVLEAARLSGVTKVILASSSSVYGTHAAAPFSETERADTPASPYAASKRAMELVAYTYSRLWKMSCICLRFFNVYGERGRPDNIPAMFTKLALSGLPIPKFGDGNSQRDYTYVGDIVEGIIRSLKLETSFEIINLGNHHPVSLNDFLTTLSEVIGQPLQIEKLPPHPADVPLTYADVTKAKKLLDWESKVNLQEGLRKYYEWFQSVSA